MEYLLSNGKRYFYIKDIVYESGIRSRAIYRRLRSSEAETIKRGNKLYIAEKYVPIVTRPLERTTKPAPHEDGFLSCKELGKRAGMSRTQARSKIRFLYQKGLLRLYTDADGKYDYVEDTPETVRLVKKNWNELKPPKEINGFYPVRTLYLHDPGFDEKGISPSTISTRFKVMKDNGKIREGVDYIKTPFRGRELFCVRPGLAKKLLYPNGRVRNILKRVCPGKTFKEINFDSIIDIAGSGCPVRTVQATRKVLGDIHSLENGHEKGYYDSIFRNLIENSIRKYGFSSIPFLVTNMTNRIQQIMEQPVENVESFFRFAEETYQREKKPDEFIMRLFEWDQN